MTLLADLTLRMSLLLLAGLGARLLLHRHSAALRHAVLAGSVFGAAAIAPLSLVLPTWQVTSLRPVESQQPAPVTMIDPAASPVPAPAASESPAVTLGVLVALVWSGGVALGAAVLLTGVCRLQWVARHAVHPPGERWERLAGEIAARFKLRRQVVICHTDTPDLLATFGLFRPRVLLPAHAREWSEDRVRVVLTHELAHIRRHDWVVQIAADVLRIVLWFNPLAWAACSRLRRDSEQACDDAVLRAGVGPRDYAAHLLELARLCRRPRSAWATATPIARPSTLERRFAAMLNPTVDRRPASLRAISLTAVLLLAITLPIAAYSARQTTPRALTGSVYDATGAVLPEVNLTIEHEQRGTWQAVTNASGRFEFPLLEPGSYVLQASLRGFRPLRHELTLRNARDWDRAITLQVGELRETIQVSEQRPAAAPAAGGSAGPQPIRVGGNIRAPKKVLDVKPVYPPSMREAGREGVVPLDAVIGEDGTVHSVRVLSANVHPDFAVAAAEAVRQWRFDPTLLNGQPIDVTITVTVTFSLSD